jgi:Gluconate 2-dehydrogenase subunit 3
MQPSRRRLLGLSLSAALVVDFRAALSAVISPQRRGGVDPLRALPAFVDTLIPADESPAATALGVDRRLVARAGRSPRYRRVLNAGCAWLDRGAQARAGLDFFNLPPRLREDLTAIAASSAAKSLPRVFFDVVREDAYTLYYADARSWAVLGYGGPPQPDGFRDFADPPRSAPR